MRPSPSGPARLCPAGARILLAGILVLSAVSAADVPEFERLLAGVGARADEAELDRLAFELARTPGSETAFLDVRARGRIAGAEGAEPVPLAPVHMAVLARVAPRLEARLVLTRVRAGSGEGSALRWRAAALELLRWHAAADDLRVTAQVASGPAGGPPAPELVEPLRVAVTEVVRRDPRALDELARIASDFEPSRGTFVRAVGMLGDARGLPWIVDQIARPAVTDVALQEAARLAPKARGRVREDLAEAVRPFLRHSEPGRRKQALRALGAVHDAASVPAILRVLEEGDSGERSGAVAALGAISGRSLPADPRVWQAWYEEQRTWLLEEADAALERLDSPRDGEVVAAIRAVSAHDLQRDRFARRLTVTLREHPAAAVRAQACLGLERLRSDVALEALARALDDDEEGVRGNALRALRAITGLELGADPEAWDLALEGP